jgi:hypothetical protein
VRFMTEPNPVAGIDCVLLVSDDGVGISPRGSTLVKTQHLDCN